MASGGLSPIRPASGVQPRKETKQRRLAGAVDPDETDHIPGCHHEIQSGEQQLVAERSAQVAGQQGCTHRR